MSLLFTGWFIFRQDVCLTSLQVKFIQFTTWLDPYSLGLNSLSHQLKYCVDWIDCFFWHWWFNVCVEGQLRYMLGSSVGGKKSLISVCELRPHLTVVALHMVVLVHRNHPDGLLRALVGRSSGKHQQHFSLWILQLHNILRPHTHWRTKQTLRRVSRVAKK